MEQQTPQDSAPLVRIEADALASAGGPLDTAIAAWLHAKHGRSGSERTRDAYAETLGGFRAALRSGGLDLDSAPELVALALQGWAGREDERSGRTPAPATFNHRIGVVSSFYGYAVRYGLLPGNPAARVERRTVESYQTARPISAADVRRRLAEIDRSSMTGGRDYALISVGLMTGRRLAELAALRWRHVTIDGERVSLAFERTKGGKSDRKVLPKATGRILVEWLHACYGAQLGDLPPDSPIWPALERDRRTRTGEALSERRMQAIVHQRLGVKFHALRHTFARAMEDAGATPREIQSQLGHSSVATTERYLDALRESVNPHGSAIERLLLPEE